MKKKTARLFSLNQFFVCKIFRLFPFDTRTIAGFLLVATINLIIITMLTDIYIIFAAIYFGVCNYIQACINDISMTINHLNEDINRNRTIRSGLKQLIELHGHCYK